MAEYPLLWLVALVILALPWNQKYTGTWNKIKKWYNYLLSGLVLSLISVVLSTSNLRYLWMGGLFDFISLIVEAVAIIVGTIGVIGICKELLFK